RAVADRRRPEHRDARCPAPRPGPPPPRNDGPRRTSRDFGRFFWLSSVLPPKEVLGTPRRGFPCLMSPLTGGLKAPREAMVARPLTTFCKAEPGRVSNFACALYTDLVNGGVHGRAFARKKGDAANICVLWRRAPSLPE